ncbi:MAG: hypothetical protein M3Q75_15215, partial [Gemmatimonadota bacterium]|nr:hypothetical protein [Gemmatimonadota bacterium]
MTALLASLAGPLLLPAWLGASLLVQGLAPSVGDTVWLNRTVRVPAGYTVRAGDWEAADPIELLGRGRVVMTGDSA